MGPGGRASGAEEWKREREREKKREKRVIRNTIVSELCRQAGEG